MFRIAIIGQKGGDGKTTITLGLAVAATEAEQSVAIIDLDPQANATNWKDRRIAENPAVISAQVSRLKQTIQTAQDYGADLVLIDTPGRSDSAAIEAARNADLVLIPVRPQIFGLETLKGVRDLLRVAGDPLAYVIVNGIHPQVTKGVETTRALIEDTFGLNVAPMHLCQRGSYAEAPTIGRSAQELDPEGKAADELRRLYMFTFELLNKLNSEHYEQK
ncbi:plasmid segregation oscillating ATPase ParF [Nitrosospira multiformis]|uniref:Plasmid segregation oscillating ATPase ParF n=1 Tax=Nitrosospira multiformis TaxID=1231 RepID=A0A2T5I1V5_9PROT|nr:ParA family protein [Nitrosospira multiformis]PTQ77814.1 plasmid segregation oscillating ATPase ParF [Nitrosospira multiformis]